MADRVITGAVIGISVTPRGGQNIVLGRAMSMAVQEQYAVRPIYGIGNMTAQELPIVSYSGGLTLEMFAIDSQASDTLLSAFHRAGSVSTPDAASFVKQLMQTDGVDITVSRRQRNADNSISETAVAKVTGAVITSESMVIQEQQIVLKNGQFVFANPVSV